MDDIDVIKAKLAMVVQQHRDLDDAIEALEKQPLRDELQIRRLKKQKLHLKDTIAYLEDQLNPDIIA
jgi:hypothetical protein